MLAVLTLNLSASAVGAGRRKSRSPTAVAKPFSEEKIPVTAAPLLSPSSPISSSSAISSSSSSSSSVASSSDASSSSPAFFSTKFRIEIPSRLEAAQQALTEGKPEEACVIYREILTRYPTHRDALYNYAQTLAQSGNKSQAIETYQQLLKYNTGIQVQATAKLIALLYTEKRYTEAELYWKQLTPKPYALINQFKDISKNIDPVILLIQGELLLALGESKKAQKCRERILDLDGRFDKSSNHLAALAFAYIEPIVPPRKSCCRYFSCC